jgi:AbrB family looped-hinge helix DNA binding protein
MERNSKNQWLTMPCINAMNAYVLYLHLRRVFPSWTSRVRFAICRAGRVVIPESLREDLHLEPGDALEMESTGEQITLRPLRGLARSAKHCVWVFHAGQPCAHPPPTNCFTKSARNTTFPDLSRAC